MGTRLDGPVPLEVVVPARNEAARLPAGLDALCAKLAASAAGARVVVVDNASTDGTAEIVRAWRGPVPVRLLRCERPGKGAAVRAGLLATTAPLIGFMDADMATDLAALDDALALLRAGEQAVVGSRRHARSVVEGYALPVRRLGAITFNRLVRDLAGGVPDTQCGFKFFAGPLGRAAAADLRTTGFSFDVELLAHCVRRGARVTAIPVVWRDRPGSTFSVRRHSLGCLLDLARIRARAILPRPTPAPPEPASTPAPAPPELASTPAPGPAPPEVASAAAQVEPASPTASASPLEPDPVPAPAAPSASSAAPAPAPVGSLVPAPAPAPASEGAVPDGDLPSSTRTGRG